MKRKNLTKEASYLDLPLEQDKVDAEKLNGRLALVGIFALIGSYLSTGQVIPGFL